MRRCSFRLCQFGGIRQEPSGLVAFRSSCSRGFAPGVHVPTIVPCKCKRQVCCEVSAPLPALQRDLNHVKSPAVVAAVQVFMDRIGDD